MICSKTLGYAESALSAMENKIKICHVCEKPVDQCVCCAECGHICSLDLGEPYCPVCFPEKQSEDK